MTHFWLGVLAGAGAVSCLVILALVAIRGAERGTEMAAGHWPADAEDDIDRELRTITREAA